MKMKMMLETKVDKTVFDTIVIFLKRFQEVEDKKFIREAFDDYIDMLFENGRITDNQYSFLELWFVWDSMQNDSGV